MLRLFVHEYYICSLFYTDAIFLIPQLFKISMNERTSTKHIWKISLFQKKKRKPRLFVIFFNANDAVGAAHDTFFMYHRPQSYVAEEGRRNHRSFVKVRTTHKI